MGALIKLNIDGKPLIKLIDVISKGCGAVYRPVGMKREADAEAYGIKAIEKAKAVAKAENSLLELETIEKIEARLIHVEQNRQKNIDRITELASEQFNDKTIVSDEPVDNEWISRFFSIAQDISSEEMQKIWAKILSEEIKKPKSFSLRTLDIIKNISSDEAKVFNNLSQFAIFYNNDKAFIKRCRNDDSVVSISDADILLLSEVGLMQFDTSIGHQMKKSDGAHTLTCGTNCFLIEDLKCDYIGFAIYPYTKSGLELLKLLKSEPPKWYLDFIYNDLKLKVDKVKYAKIIENDGKNITIENFKEY